MITFAARRQKVEAGPAIEVDNPYRTALLEIRRVCLAAAQGDLEPRITNITEGGEVGETLRGLNQFLDLTDAFVRESGAALVSASQGRFFRRVLLQGLKGSFRGSAQLINNAVEEMARNDAARSARQKHAREFEATILDLVGGVASASTELRATAQALSTLASTMTEQSESVAAAATQSAQSLASVAAAVEEVSGTISEVHRQAQHSSALATSAAEETHRTDVTVSSLSQASQEISRVVGLITQVAGQTRLLALNATIEAARAGELGRGFAVVASEVKGLATQTATATQDIESRVSAIQGATQGAVGAIHAVGNTVRELAGISESVSTAVAEQRTVSADISASVQEAAQGTAQVSQSITLVVDSARETSRSAADLLSASEGIATLSENLRTQIGTFVELVRQ